MASMAGVHLGSRRLALELTATGAVALGVGAVVLHVPQLVPRLLALGVAVIAIAVASRHIVAATATMIVFVPLQQPLLAYLYAHGWPAALVRNLGFYKELVTVAAVVAAVRAAKGRPRKLDALDGFVLAYLGVLAFFLLGPAMVPGGLGGQPFFARLTDFRSLALFVIAFFALRRLSWKPRDVSALSFALIVTALLNGYAVLWERYSNAGFERFTFQTLNIASYYNDVLHLPLPFSFVVMRDTTVDLNSLRAGGWFYAAGASAFFTVVAIALVVRLLAEGRPKPWLWLAAPVLALTLALTQTRSSVLAAALAVALIIAAGARFRLPGRVRLVAVLLLGALLTSPFIGSSGLANRVSSAVAESDQSTAGHASGSSRALSFVLRHPAGSGLATHGEETDAQGKLPSAENAYLQIGTELGIVPMLMFVVILLLTLRQLRAARSDGRLSEATGIWAAGWALAANGMFLHVWLPFGVSMSFWSLAAAAIAASSASHQNSPDAP